MLQLRIYILLIMFGGVFMLFFKKTYKARLLSLTSYTDLVDTNIRSFGRERYLNGTIEFKKDFGDDLYSVSAESFIDSNGNGEYKQLPMFIPRQPICKALATAWKYIDESVKYGVNTDFPARFHPCPIPKGIYYVKNVTAKTDDWPDIMPRGFLKGVFTLHEGKKDTGTAVVVIEISDIS